VFLTKIIRKNLQKFSQQAAPKNLSEKNYFQEKFVDVKFYKFVRKIFGTDFFHDRAKPRKLKAEKN
jgi:hypothetical protein